MARVTIILPVSRKDYLNRVFAQLELLDCDKEQTNLIVYVDGSLELFQFARNLTVNSKFNEKLCVYRKKGVPTISSVRRRRQRIADIHNEIRGLLNKGDYILLLEDDTLFPTNSLKTLLEQASQTPNFGVLSAIQLGRWGYKHIGAWDFDDIYDPDLIISPEQKTGIHQTDATGFYCCLVKHEYYSKHDFQPYDTILGPDVNYGISMRQLGLKNYINYDLKCQHLTKQGTIKADEEVDRVKFEKNEESKLGWTQGKL